MSHMERLEQPLSKDYGLTQFSVTHLTDAQILALGATKVQLTPEPPAGHMIVPFLICSTYVPGSVDFALVGNRPSFVLGDPQANAWSADFLTNQDNLICTTNFLRLMADTVETPTFPYGGALYLFTNGPESYEDGDGTVTISVLYQVVPIS